MKYDYERFANLKEARERCKELERQHKGRFCGIYKGHREYVVQITDPFSDPPDPLANPLNWWHQ